MVGDLSQFRKRFFQYIRFFSFFYSTQKGNYISFLGVFEIYDAAKLVSFMEFHYCSACLFYKFRYIVLLFWIINYFPNICLAAFLFWQNSENEFSLVEWHWNRLCCRQKQHSRSLFYSLMQQCVTSHPGNYVFVSFYKSIPIWRSSMTQWESI